MPKIVDHDQRRRDLSLVTQRIIVRQGFAGATMRDIAAEAGYANGAIRRYFESKADLIAATYLNVVDATNDRIRWATRDLTGLAALEAFAREMFPINDVLHDEARVVVFFWGEVAQSERLVRITRETMEQWLERIITCLEQARSEGELSESVNIRIEAEIWLANFMGAQVNHITDGARYDAGAFEAQLSYWLGRLSA